MNKFILERNVAFENDDFLWAGRMLPDSFSARVALTAFHKARYECPDISVGKRRESQKWLADRGLRTTYYQKVIYGDDLP